MAYEGQEQLLHSATSRLRNFQKPIMKVKSKKRYATSLPSVYLNGSAYNYHAADNNSAHTHLHMNTHTCTHTHTHNHTQNNNKIITIGKRIQVVLEKE